MARRTRVTFKTKSGKISFLEEKMKIVAVAFSVKQENSIGYRKFTDWDKLKKWLSLISEQADFCSLRFIK